VDAMRLRPHPYEFALYYDIKNKRLFGVNSAHSLLLGLAEKRVLGGSF